MGFFDDNDPFENMIERMFGGNSNFPSGEKSYSRQVNSLKNLIETKKYFYFVLDLSNLKNINLEIKQSPQTFIEISGDGNIFQYAIPKNIAKRKFEWTFKNGILEVAFKK
ncbi:MAG: Hsp20/alpha crystallin family protein [Candidatus Pacearchaeota archaeon]|jgi:hypothetical protein